MGYLSKNSEESIHHQLIETIKKKLLNGFKDGYHRHIENVETVNVSFEIDEDKSDRDIVVVKSVNSVARVWVKLQNHNALANNTLQIRIVKPIDFPFDENSKEYRIENEAAIEIIDVTPI